MATVTFENATRIYPGNDRPSVDALNLEIADGEFLVLVGPSGCGKSISSMAVMGLLPPSARISGEILFKGRNILEMTPAEHNALRGHEMSMVYQDALSSLNPSMLIRTQMAQLSARGGTRSAEELLELVGLDPKRTLRSYPHELSGGQRQRVWIAMALAQETDILLLDEPTTYLDLAHQVELLDLLADLNEERGTTMIMGLHELNLAARVADYLIAMKDGQIVSRGSAHEVLTSRNLNDIFGLKAKVADPFSDGSVVVVPHHRYAHASQKILDDVNP